MNKKTNYEFMVETADFYRVRNEEARKEVARLREALEKISASCPPHIIQSVNAEVAATLAFAAGLIARVALGEKE